MATNPQQIQDLLDKLESTYKKIGTTNPFKSFDASVFQNANDAISILNSGLRDAQRELADINSDVTEISVGFKNIVSELKRSNTGLSQATKSFNSLSNLAQKLKYDQADISNLNREDLVNLKKKAFEERQNLITAKATLETKQKAGTLTDPEKDALGEINGLLSGQDGLFRGLIAKTNARIKQEERIEELMGLGGAAVKSTQTALDKLGLGGLAKALGLDEVSKKMQETAKEIENTPGASAGSFANKFKVLKAGAKEAGIQLLKSLKDPLTAAKYLVEQMIDALQKTDKLAGDTAKAFNLSYTDALALNGVLNRTANLTGDIAVNTKALNESMIAVGKSLGSNAVLNEKDLITFTKLREQAGYTNDELLGIQKLSLTTNTTLEDNTKAILGSAEAYAAQNKLVINEKDVLKEVNKASAALKLSLKGGASALAESVVKSKQFGLNLEQADQIASGLLNFEQSISNELEAELLTGKDLNFEQTRYLALNNDIAGAAAEIARQVGTSADFAKMNRIQQEAIAKAAGLNREELAQSLIDREALAALSAKEGETSKQAFDRLVGEVGLEEAKKRLGNEQLATQFQQQSLQERFNQSIVKLQELFVALAEPVLAILSPLMDIGQVFLPLINVVLQPVYSALKAIAEVIKVNIAEPLEGLKGIFKGLIDIINGDFAAGFEKIGKSLVRIILSPFQAITSGIVVLVNELIAMINKIPGVNIQSIGKVNLSDKIMGEKSMAFANGGIVTKPITNATIGEAGPEAIIPLSKTAGSEAVIPLSKVGGGNSGGLVNLTPLVDRMMAVEKLLTNILNKEGVIYIDSTKLGTAVSMGTYKTT